MSNNLIDSDFSTLTPLGHSPPENNCFEFKAVVKNVKSFAHLLKALDYSGKLDVLIKEEGIKFVSQEGQILQCTCYIKKEFFQEFYLKAEEIRFRISFKELFASVRSLSTNFHGESTGSIMDDGQNPNNWNTGDDMSIEFKIVSPDRPLYLLLKKTDFEMEFEVKTDEFEDDLFENGNPKNEIIFKSEYLDEILLEVEENEPEFITLIIEEKKHFKIQCVGTSGPMSISIPQRCEAIEKFICKENCKLKFRMNVFKKFFKTLGLSEKVSMQIDSVGLLQLVFLLHKVEAHFDFYCLAQCAGEDSSDEGEHPASDNSDNCDR